MPKGERGIAHVSDVHAGLDVAPGARSPHHAQQRPGRERSEDRCRLHRTATAFCSATLSPCPPGLTVPHSASIFPFLALISLLSSCAHRQVLQKCPEGSPTCTLNDAPRVVKHLHRHKLSRLANARLGVPILRKGRQAVRTIGREQYAAFGGVELLLRAKHLTFGHGSPVPTPMNQHAVHALAPSVLLAKL